MYDIVKSPLRLNHRTIFFHFILINESFWALFHGGTRKWKRIHPYSYSTPHLISSNAEDIKALKKKMNAETPHICFH